MAKLPHQSSVPPVDPQDSAIKSDGGAAESLQTTTTDVVVSGATAPAAGQVLTAIDGVSADWQAPSAGGAAPINASVVNTESANFYDTDDQFASVADPNVFQGLTAMTVECWFTLDRIDGGFYGFCGQASAGDTNVAFTLRASNTGVLTAVFSVNGTVVSQELTFSHGASVGKWRHVAVTWDGATGNASAYINGVLVAGPTALVAGTIYNSTANFNIGRYSDQNFNYEHHGKLSELRIWNVARTASQVLDSLYGVAKGNEDGLVTVHHLSGDWRDTGPNSSVHLTPDANAPTFVKDLPFGLHTVLPTRSAGQNAQSYNFIGSVDDRLFLGSTGIFGRHAALSIECWIKPTSALVNLRGLCSQANVFQINAINATQIRVGFSTNGVITFYTITPGWVIGEWTHLACTWDGVTGNMKTYVDGVLTGGTGVGQKGKTFANTLAFSIGIADGILEGWDGNISEFRIWNTERSQDQILASMYGVMTGGEEGIIVLYHFDGDYKDSGPFEKTLSVGNAPVLTDDVPHGPQAHSLLTSGSPVEIAASSPPTAGQGLVADSPTTASWQDLATGGSSGPLASAQGAYMVKNMGSSQGGVVSGTLLNFDTIISSRGDLGGAGNQVTGLKAGRTYLLIGRSRVSGGNFSSIRFYDATAAAYLGDAKTATGADIFLTPNVTHIFTPAVETAIELWCNSANVSSTFDGALSEIQVIEIGAVQADVVGGLEFMDIIELDADATTISFGAAGDGVFQRALDGDVDESYVCEFYFPAHATSIADVELRPNGVSTNMAGARQFGGNTTGGNAQPTIYLIENMSPNFTYGGSFEFNAKAGKARKFSSVYHQYDGSSVGNNVNGAGTWTDESTNVTSLEIFSPVANTLKSGARLVLWRRTHTNLRADSASTYERAVPAAVEEGTNTTEYTTGLATHGGSAIGVSALLDLAVTAGTVVINVKVAGTTKLTVTLDTTNTTQGLQRKSIGEVPISASDEIIVEIIATGYTNAGSVASGIMVQVKCIDSAQILDGAQPRRVLPDSSDLLIFEGDVDGPGNLLNTGSDAAASIAPVGSPIDGLTGFFGKAVGCVTNTARNLYEGAATVEPSTAITISAWMYLRELHTSAWMIIKPYNATYVSPFTSAGLNMNATPAVGGGVSVGGVRTLAVATMRAPEATWFHAGMTYDSASGDIFVYLDGVQVATANTGGGVIDYGSNRPWSLGDPPGSTIVNPDAHFSDVRIADVVRDSAWFEDVWRRGKRLT